MTIKEDNISLEFSGQMIKYDDTNFYRKHIVICHETKAIDILALEKSPLFMIEIKDFRNYRIENKERINNGDLAIEFAHKIRDTIAGLYGAFRSNNEELEIFYSYLFCGKHHSIKAILLMEEDQAQNIYENKRRKILHRELKTKIEQQLGFFSVHSFVINILELNTKNWDWTVL
ncbi:MAG: hypothetical protein H7A23_14440 [Leptospiraceae bacterium]|nr:hypothetical protein [Leptospiraceae bacterium]MCP5495750.1 hypothetical protein [Leptospiraceae bacterium]